jgi:hypothetical protein
MYVCYGYQEKHAIRLKEAVKEKEREMNELCDQKLSNQAAALDEKASMHICTLIYIHT